MLLHWGFLKELLKKFSRRNLFLILYSSLYLLCEILFPSSSVVPLIYLVQNFTRWVSTIRLSKKRLPRNCNIVPNFGLHSVDSSEKKKCLFWTLCTRAFRGLNVRGSNLELGAVWLAAMVIHWLNRSALNGGPLICHQLQDVRIRRHLRILTNLCPTCFDHSACIISVVSSKIFVSRF